MDGVVNLDTAIGKAPEVSLRVSLFGGRVGTRTVSGKAHASDFCYESPARDVRNGQIQRIGGPRHTFPQRWFALTNSALPTSPHQARPGDLSQVRVRVGVQASACDSSLKAELQPENQVATKPWIERAILKSYSTATSSVASTSVGATTTAEFPQMEIDNACTSSVWATGTATSSKTADFRTTSTALRSRI